MTAKQFYLRALTVPVVTPLVAGAVYSIALLSSKPWSSTMASVAATAAFVGAIGLVSAIPYGLFIVGFLLWLRRPHSVRTMWTVPWLIPVIIGIPVAIFAASPDLQRAAWHDAAGMAILWGGCALLVGYAYAIPIQLVYAILKLTGRIQEAA